MKKIFLYLLLLISVGGYAQSPINLKTQTNISDYIGDELEGRLVDTLSTLSDTTAAANVIGRIAHVVDVDQKWTVNSAGSWEVLSGGGGTSALSPLLVVASGQSNMDGAGSGGFIPDEDPDIQFLDPQTGQFRTLSYTNRLERVNINTGNPIFIPAAVGNNNMAFAFCHRLKQETGRPIRLVIVSNGGTHIGRWVDGGTSAPLYNELDTMVTRAISLIPGKDSIDVFLWAQGETKRPGFESVADYRNDFSTLRSQLAAEPWWNENAKFIVSEMVPGSGFDEYQEFFRELNIDGDPLTACVSGKGLNYENTNFRIHWDGSSLFELGYYRIHQTYLAGSGTDYTRPPLLNQTIDQGLRDYYHIQNELLGKPITLWPLQGAKVDNAGPASVYTALNGFTNGQRILSSVNCVAVINDNGSHTVTPSTSLLEGSWSYKYVNHPDRENLSPQIVDTATVTGIVDMSIVEKFSMTISDDVSANIAVDFAQSDVTVYIDWGDGDIDTVGDNTLASHTYASSFTGRVKVSSESAAIVRSIQSSDGKWVNSLLNFSDLDGLLVLKITSSDNLVSGDLGMLPRTVNNINFGGQNTITGNIGLMPSGVLFAEIYGQNTLSGSINTVNPTINTFRITGQNTLSGNFKSLKNIVICEIRGNNTISGTLADLPESVSFLVLEGNNTISGDLSELPLAIRTLEVFGNNTINTPTPDWGGDVDMIRLALGGATRTSTQIDQLLASLALVQNWLGAGLVLLNYPNNAARTSASDTDVATIQSNGGNVFTN